MKKTKNLKEGIEIGRKDVILRKELADIERNLIKEIKSTDCFIQYDLLGLFTLTGFVEKKMKQATLTERQRILDLIKKDIKNAEDEIKKLGTSKKVYEIGEGLIDYLKKLIKKIGEKEKENE